MNSDGAGADSGSENYMNRARAFSRKLGNLLLMPLEMFRQFLEQANASGSRSTALKPLGWLLGILMFGLLGGAQVGLPLWALVVLAVFVCLAGLLYLGAYLYFMMKNPDALRSEQYAINKLAIEKQLVGDNVQGVMTADHLPSKMLPQLSDKTDTTAKLE
jgi:hypothetical protein